MTKEPPAVPLVLARWDRVAPTICASCAGAYGCAGEFRWKWCEHVLCAVCASGVVKSCPLCGARGPVIADDMDTGPEESAPATPMPWQPIMWVLLAAGLIGLLAWMDQ